ncbi:PREDICTED: uncharacterized protein LOC104787346 [Camelina sativa]|uniref:Uncharacterized protein LOC104787346 n=1 Tax=Camelina sativa TaxID=90675 RepID=A0ABM0Z6S1_CAMSA|nr:PREDICTED: uncharacterized protein LOC104787346 [Camelina sativa]
MSSQENQNHSGGQTVYRRFISSQGLSPPIPSRRLPSSTSAPRVASPASSQGTSPVIQDNRQGTSPVVEDHLPPQHSTSRVNDVSPQTSSFTLEELLASPGRASLQKLDPKRPPGTLWFAQDPQVAATVRAIFERDFKEVHANWTQTPGAVVNRWFETFAQTYNWDHSINGRVRAEFESKLKTRMTDQVSRWKSKWRVKGDDAMPRWLDPKVWEGLVKFWSEPKSEEKSINSRNARYSDPDGNGMHKHRSGQTSFKARARKHSEMTGEALPDFLKVLEDTHRKPDGSFVDGLSEKVYNEVSSRITEAETGLCSGDNIESSASGGLSVSMKNQIFAEVAPKKKNRIYGVGNMQTEASSAHVVLTPTPTEDPVILAEKLSQAEAVLASQSTQLEDYALKLQQNTQKMHCYDAYFDYLSEKDPEFAARFPRPETDATIDTGAGDTTRPS